MANSRLAAALAAVALALPALAGCGNDYTGTVTDKSGYGKYRRLTVQEQSGDKHRFRPTRSAFKACAIGDRWPDCKQGS